MLEIFWKRFLLQIPEKTNISLLGLQLECDAAVCSFCCVVCVCVFDREREHSAPTMTDETFKDWSNLVYLLLPLLRSCFQLCPVVVVTQPSPRIVVGTRVFLSSADWHTPESCVLTVGQEGAKPKQCLMWAWEHGRTQSKIWNRCVSRWEFIWSSGIIRAERNKVLYLHKENSN